MTARPKERARQNNVNAVPIDRQGDGENKIWRSGAHKLSVAGIQHAGNAAAWFMLA
jgi:hypothetical protein